MENTEQKGFTLIELLVVVAVIGILTTICLICSNSYKTKVKCARGDDEACSMLSEEEIENLKKEPKEKETNLDRAKRICPYGILEFTGNPSATRIRAYGWEDLDFKVICK